MKFLHAHKHKKWVLSCLVFSVDHREKCLAQWWSGLSYQGSKETKAAAFIIARCINRSEKVTKEAEITIIQCME